MTPNVLRNGTDANGLLHAPNYRRTRGSRKLGPFWTWRWHLSQRPYLYLTPEHPILSITSQCLRVYFMTDKCCIWYAVRCKDYSVTSQCMNMNNWRNDTDREARQHSEKSVPVPLCAPQSPNGQAWQQNWASAVSVRRLTARAMARPDFFMTHC